MGGRGMAAPLRTTATPTPTVWCSTCPPPQQAWIYTALRESKRVTADELAVQIQRDSTSAKRTLEALVAAGLVQSHGNTPRTRSYTLSASLYGALGDKAAFTRLAGFSAIQHEQMVLNFVRQHGQIRRSEVITLCRLTDGQTKDLLKRMKEKGLLQQHEQRRRAFYTLGPTAGA